MSHMQSITFNVCAASRFSATSGPSCLRYGFIEVELWLLLKAQFGVHCHLFHRGIWGQTKGSATLDHRSYFFGKAMEEFINVY